MSALFIFGGTNTVALQMKGQSAEEIKVLQNTRRSGTRARGREKLAAVRPRGLELLAAVGRVDLAPRSPCVARALDRTARTD